MNGLGCDEKERGYGSALLHSRRYRFRGMVWSLWDSKEAQKRRSGFSCCCITLHSYLGVMAFDLKVKSVTEVEKLERKELVRSI